MGEASLPVEHEFIPDPAVLTRESLSFRYPSIS